MRPTGRLHLGHFFGALSNWLKLQQEYDCYFFVADWHALTTHYEDTSSIAENTLQVAMDWLAVGLDPQKSTLFVQSQVLEHAELHVLLSMITPLSWLERVPTYKEQIEKRVASARRGRPSSPCRTNSRSRAQIQFPIWSNR
jgi:tryptophanyl-tRNA synthetase